MSFDDYVNIDNNVITMETMTISEITGSILQETDDEHNDEEPSQTPGVSVMPLMSYKK